MTVSVTEGSNHSGVSITRVDMPFWHLVGFLVRLSLASIPAMIILWIIGVLLAGIAFAIFGALGLGLSAMGG